LKIAVFPCKADPLHVGHLIQIKRLLKEYPRVIVDIYVYEGRCMSFCEVVDILEELFAERSRGLIFEKHKNLIPKVYQAIVKKIIFCNRQ